MTSLKSLNIVPLPKLGGNPTIDRRTRVIARLEEQRLLLNDSSYMRSVRSWSKGDDGKKVLVETKQRVLPWWSAQPNGSLVFFIRSGWKPIELEKGKAAIAVQSLDKLPMVIDTRSQCPLLGVKQTSARGSGMSAFDPKRTSAQSH